MKRTGTRIVVFAPNWLGDAVMAVPCLEMLKRANPGARIAVAARGHLAPLYEMVPGVDEVVRLRPVGRLGGAVAALADARRLRRGGFDKAVLLPNSFRSALIARLAGIPERHGYATDGRGWLLTHATPRLQRVHMVEFYRRLGNGVGTDFDDHNDVSQKRDWRNQSRPHLSVPGDARERARALLAEQGWTPGAGAALVGMAPGAAYGTAKQWLPERFAELAAQLGAAGVRTVLVGTAADREVCEQIRTSAVRSRSIDRSSEVRSRSNTRLSEVGEPTHRDLDIGPRTSDINVINLAGRTSLAELAAVIAECVSFVTNDSGAMHVAVAVGTPVTAIFGPTQEWETGPDYPILDVRTSGPPDLRTSMNTLLIGEVPCRPCMLRECPTQHECMVAVTVDRVKDAVFAQLAAGKTR